MKIAICTGGGDCPGLNAVIRAVVKHSKLSYGAEVVGVYDSFNGLLEDPKKARSLEIDDVTDILSLGGTMLGTYNKGGTFKGSNGKAQIDQAVESLQQLGVDCLIVVGGEGTQTMAQQLADLGVNIIGVPKTIDNDLPGTQQTIGFSSCVDFVSDSVMRLRSTAESHDRVMILEVMGRDSGYIALHGGIAGDANIILLPEIPFDYSKIYQKIEQRRKMGRKFSLIVASEGAYELGGQPQYQGDSKKYLGGIGQTIAQNLTQRCDLEMRVTVLGHLQRGGAPNAVDKIFATQAGVKAVDLAHQKKYGRVVVYKDGRISDILYSDIKRYQRRKIEPDDELLSIAESTGICLGR